MSLRPGRAGHQSIPQNGGGYYQQSPSSGGGGYGSQGYGQSPPPRPPPRPGATSPANDMSGYTSGGSYTPTQQRAPSPTTASPYYGGGYGNNSYGSSYGGNTNGGSSYGGFSGASGHQQMAQQQHNASLDLRKTKRKGKKNSASSSGIPSICTQLWLWTTIASVLGFGLAIRKHLQIRSLYSLMAVDSMDALHYQINDLTSKNRQNQRSMQSVKDSLKIANERKASLEKDTRGFQQKIAETEREAKEAKAQMEKLGNREKAWKEQVTVLQQKTSRESERSVREKFGDGPYQVEFAVVFPGEDPEKNRRFFVVEMAPVTVMPHAIHLFLEQVSHGLWDNAWFYINGPHLIQVGPQAEDESEDEEEARKIAVQPFKDEFLDTLSFPEYSADFTHKPWTLGYTGRPGGPDFYINKIDNTEAHGPGGQYQHDLNEFADPCFAKVIKGFNILEEVAGEATILEGDYKYFFEYPVHIVKAIVLKKPITVEASVLEARKEGFGHIPLREWDEEFERKKAENRNQKLQRHFPKQQIEHQTEA